ncbi:MAG: ABC transporter ATP-binding protein [Chloroflexi bacterium]|nr:ABC transporter ATP-binding protein [Chloroflexota bacterium]
MTTPVLQLENITKHFPGVLANASICFDLLSQEIHAVLGENGAGKTTLMNIVYGLYKPDSGRILVNNEPADIEDPNDALRAGIGMVHQHFKLVPVMTVTENLMLGHEKTRGLPLGMLGRLDRKQVSQEIRSLGERYGLRVDPDATVEDLSVGEAQRVEILKVLYKGADILILDEPTAVLTPQETEELFEIMRALVGQGKSIIFITHKLKEVRAVANRITVLRQGKVVGTTTPDAVNMAELAAMMVGRAVLLTVDRGQSHPKGVVLSVEKLTVPGKSNQPVVNDVSFGVRAGEIYGIAGVQGNGQTELVEAITGLKKSVSGNVKILGKDITNLGPRLLAHAGLAHVPEDRQKHGLVLAFSVEANLVLETYYQQPFSDGWWIHPQEMRKNAKKLVAEFDIRTPSVSIPVSSLSGGNQQKVIIARELSRAIKLLVINQPTRGLDVGSIEFIHKRIIEARDQGVAVLLISVELDEILSLSDRIGVMYNGRMVAEIPASAAKRETLGYYMAGLRVEQSANKNVS